jgi:hypothetical protein
MKYILLFVLLGVVLCDIGINFETKQSLYSARFGNCTNNESKLMKCLNGVCLSRTDTLQRQPFCLCLTGYDGKRCETNEIPFEPMTIGCEYVSYTHVIVLCVILAVLGIFSGGLLIFYIKRNLCIPISLSQQELQRQHELHRIDLN